MKDLFDISGKVVLVTGGSRGIGEMIAEGFVANGVRTYISARKADACDATAARLSAMGECISIPADLCTMEGIRELSDAIKARETQLDVLVNNAGAAWGAPLEEFPESGWDKVMDINVKSPFFLTQALLPEFFMADYSTGDLDGMRLRSRSNAKYPAARFEADSSTKREKASKAIG